MPVFSYQGFDANGANETGTIEASSENLAYEILERRGVTVFELTNGSVSAGDHTPFYRRDIRVKKRQLPFEDQAVVADLLATLFGAGLSSLEVVRIAALTSERSELKTLFERVGQRVADGSRFSDAFEAENQLFSPMFVSFLKVSDTANALPQLLRELARFLRKQNIIRQKVISALIYPVILIAAAMALLFVVVFYLAPNLGPIFGSVAKAPPRTLSILLAINEVLGDYWVLALFLLSGMLVAIIGATQAPRVRARFSILAFHLPILGTLLQLTLLARLSQAAELLLLSGQPLSTALKTSAEVMGGTSLLGTRFREAAKAIDEGSSASEAFANASEIPPAFKELFRIGEETNRLPSTLNALSNSMTDRVDRQAERLLNLMTPVLTLALGIGIGALIYILMGAILEVNELAF